MAFRFSQSDAWDSGGAVEYCLFRDRELSERPDQTLVKRALSVFSVAAPSNQGPSHARSDAKVGDSSPVARCVCIMAREGCWIARSSAVAVKKGQHDPRKTTKYCETLSKEKIFTHGDCWAASTERLCAAQQNRVRLSSNGGRENPGQASVQRRAV